MPELPEVETVAVDLNAYLCGKTILNIEVIGRHKLLQTPLLILRKSLSGQKIKRVYRRAKMVIVEFKEQALMFHLKMTGQLIYVLKKPLVAGGHPIQSTGVDVPNKFTRVVFYFKGGGALYFNDLRKFGWVKLLSLKEFGEMEEKLGLEPLSKKFSLAVFKNMLERRRNSTIKAALLDQQQLVGLGNIYVDEVLFRAGIRPDRKSGSLQDSEIKALWRAIPAILKLAVKQRGTTFSNFLDPDGLKGNFVSYLKVYGRAGKPCLVCGRPIKKSRLAGRGTHWCEKCQK